MIKQDKILKCDVEAVWRNYCDKADVAKTLIAESYSEVRPNKSTQKCIREMNEKHRGERLLR